MMSEQFCPNYSKWIYTRSNETGEIRIARTRCKSWSCEYCAAENRRVWIARMLFAVHTRGSRWSFVTLTAHEKTRTTESSHKNLATGWNRLNLRVKRKFREFSFVRVWELHKNGAFHAHFLWQGWPSETWLKDNARECGMGYMADVSELDADRAQAVFYVAKYMTKQDDFPKGVRRIVASRNFPDKVNKTGQKWQVLGHELTMKDAETLAWKQGLDLLDIQTGHVYTYDDFYVGESEVSHTLLY